MLATSNGGIFLAFSHKGDGSYTSYSTEKYPAYGREADFRVDLVGALAIDTSPIAFENITNPQANATAQQQYLEGMAPLAVEEVYILAHIVNQKDENTVCHKAGETITEEILEIIAFGVRIIYFARGYLEYPEAIKKLNLDCS